MNEWRTFELTVTDYRDDDAVRGYVLNGRALPKARPSNATSNTTHFTMHSPVCQTGCY